MRAILIDWLIDVNLKFNFQEETLFLTINIIDTYLSKKKICRQRLQLLGVSALLIACKHNEIIFRRIKEYAYITDNAYTPEEIKNMEFDITVQLDFAFLAPTPLCFYEHILQLLGFRNDQKKYNFGLFIMETFMIDRNCMRYSNSTIACAVAYIIMKFFKMKDYQRCYDGKLFNYKVNDEIKAIDINRKGEVKPVHIIKECAKIICGMMNQISKSKLKATVKKFKNSKFYGVSDLIVNVIL